jgi:hypothetical protein
MDLGPVYQLDSISEGTQIRTYIRLENLDVTLIQSCKFISVP